MFVPGKPFQPGLIFVGEARSLHYSEAPKKCFTWVVWALPAYNRLGWRCLPGTNALAYHSKGVSYVRKSLITLTPEFALVHAGVALAAVQGGEVLALTRLLVKPEPALLSAAHFAY